MRRFSPLQALYMSFFSKDLYRDVVKNWRGICFWYLFVLVLSVWTLEACRAMVDLRVMADQMRKEAEPLISDLPRIKVDGGTLSMDRPSPYIYKVDNQPFIVIDTSGNTKSMEESNAAFMLATRDMVYLRSQSGQQRALPVARFQSMEVTPELLRYALHQIEPAWLTLVMVTGLVFVFPFHLFLALIYAVVGVIMGSLTGGKLLFSEAMRVAAVAMTPGVLVSGLAGIANGGMIGSFGPSPLVNVASVIAAIVYLLLASQAVAADRDATAEPQASSGSAPESPPHGPKA